MRLMPLFLLSIVVLALEAIAAAQEIPCTEGPCLRPRAVGTHFLAEINGGSGLNGRGGLVIGGVLGVGGQLRRVPLPLYLVSEFSYSASSQEGSGPTPRSAFRDERSYRDLALGLRVYVPIVGPLRLFADLLGGTSHASATLEREAWITPISATGWSGLAMMAIGLQMRLFYPLSLGVRARVVFTGDALEELPVATASPIRASFLASMVWHF
jgi:hypothetical protein